MADLKKFVEEVKELSVMELNDLVKMLEEEFGVSAAAMAVAAPAAGAAPAAEEASELTVRMTAYDASQKIAAIKAVREIANLGLSEAKALVDGVPSIVKENVPAAEAKEMAEKLKAAGITVELK